MEKTLLITSSAAEGRIQIIGSISEWNKNSASVFRAKCEVLKDNKVAKPIVYINTVGGDCFQANEITNILFELFPQGYVGEGGAIVASAGTYIAVRANSFTMAKNGQFMIHKPMGGCWGNEDEFEAYLELLKNMTSEYYGEYVAKLKKPEADFKEKWNKGDFWMTAKQAVEWGFITSVNSQEAKIDAQLSSAIKATGSPIEAKINISQTNTDMELQATAIAMGMPANSTEEAVTAKIKANAEAAEELATLKASQEQKEQKEQKEKIETALNNAVKDKQITAESRKEWEETLNANYESGIKVLQGLPKAQKFSNDLSNGAAGEGTYKGKTFEELQDESPEVLAELEEKQPAVFDELFNSYKKRNNIN